MLITSIGDHFLNNNTLIKWDWGPNIHAEADLSCSILMHAVRKSYFSVESTLVNYLHWCVILRFVQECVALCCVHSFETKQKPLNSFFMHCAVIM